MLEPFIISTLFPIKNNFVTILPHIFIHFHRWQLEYASFSKDGMIWLVIQSIDRQIDSTIMLLWAFS